MRPLVRVLDERFGAEGRHRILKLAGLAIVSVAIIADVFFIGLALRHSNAPAQPGQTGVVPATAVTRASNTATKGGKRAKRHQAAGSG
jgi:hypothetical protein